MSEMVERVAKVLKSYVSRQYCIHHAVGDDAVLNFDDMAKLVIEAMREPSDAMRDAISIISFDMTKQYRNMIDAALKE